MISIILVEPQFPGNIGAIARSMKNFGFSNLILVNPKCEIDQEARNRAKHANDILDNVQILKEFPEMDYLIGTSCKTGNDYNIPRNPITPKELKEVIPKEGNIGIVFGRESDGLSNEELDKCDFLVMIPTNEDYASMNLSHAVTIVLYELSNFKIDITPISLNEKKQLMKMLDEVLEKMDFVSEDKRDTQRLVWKKIIGKSFMSKREAFALMGFFKKIL
ncbi:RNA methyltransferase [Candidatus Woesearchaeota archaeon]|nr:RNA methyltransferase [Candidatus Woesearchaeota archaeon]